jgi:hypothetical protein
MSRLFVGNLDFEHELAAPSGWNPSVVLRRIAAERAASWIALADDGDWIWTPEPIPDEFWESLTQLGLPRVRGVVDLSSVAAQIREVVPWGWSAWTRGIARETVRPGESAVRQGNSRAWSFALERELGVELLGAARLERIDDLAEAVRRSASEFGEPASDHRWVVKANFGMAARERLLGRGLNLTLTQRSWLSRRFAAEGALFFEPWLHRRAEAGIQWTLPPLGQGTPKLEGLTPLLCDSRGGYQGSEFSLDTSIPREWSRAVDVCEQAATRLQTLGYLGPLGIDAAIYEDAAGTAHVRPLQDINARYTMGRLALGFRRLLRGDERGVWRHGRSEELLPPAAGEAVREIDLTPALVGGRRPTHGSRLWIRGAGFQPARLRT